MTRLQAELIKYETGRKGGKLIFSIDNEQAIAFEPSLARYRNQPILLDLHLDLKEVERLQAQISPDQRKKIYAILKDIAEHIGDSVEAVKVEMKRQYQAVSWGEDFSLSDCDTDTASGFIEWLIDYCFMQGVPLKEHPRKYIDNVERYQYICLKNKICCVCGQPAEIHHFDAIGIGRNRQGVDDSSCRKMALCRKHHAEIHQIGKDGFCGKYHVAPVIFEGGAPWNGIAE